MRNCKHAHELNTNINDKRKLMNNQNAMQRIRTLVKPSLPQIRFKQSLLDILLVLITHHQKGTRVIKLNTKYD